MLMRINAAADRWLWARGIGSGLFRRALRALAALALAALIVGLALAGWTPQIWCFGLGTAFAGVNLFYLTQTAGAAIAQPAEAGLRRWAGVLAFLRIALTLAAVLLISRFVPRAYAGLLAGLAAGTAVLTLFGLIGTGRAQE